MTRKRPKCKCSHCNEFFLADYRNRQRQEFCTKEACRAASKRESQRRWLKKPGNEDYFCGQANTQRVKEWRQENPGYWKRSKRPTKSAGTLQEVCSAQDPVSEPVVKTSDLLPLQDLCSAQPLLLVGLIASFIGSPLQEDIVRHLRQLIAKGRQIVGHGALDSPTRS